MGAPMAVAIRSRGAATTPAPQPAPARRSLPATGPPCPRPRRPSQHVRAARSPRRLYAVARRAPQGGCRRGRRRLPASRTQLKTPAELLGIGAQADQRQPSVGRQFPGVCPQLAISLDWTGHDGGTRVAAAQDGAEVPRPDRMVPRISVLSRAQESQLLQVEELSARARTNEVLEDLPADRRLAAGAGTADP